MTYASTAALFGVMVVLAAIPGVSALAVSARSAASGFVHGAWTTLGIVTGDIIFILAAVFGLSVLADGMGGLFVLVKYAGGVYLIWLGVALCRSAPKSLHDEQAADHSPASSFLTGLLITLGDQKAILFYLGFLPAFVDLSRVSLRDTAVIVAAAVAAVGGVKLAYAYLADRAGRWLDSGTTRRINIGAGALTAAVGAFLVARA